MTDQTNHIAGSRTDVIEADDTTSVGRSRSLRVARDDREAVLAALKSTQITHLLSVSRSAHLCALAA